MSSAPLDLSTLANRIAYLRHLAREEEGGDPMNQPSLSRLAGLSSGAVRSIETTSGSTGVDTVRSIAAACSEEPDALAAWLAYRVGKMPTRKGVRAAIETRAQRAGATS